MFYKVENWSGTVLCSLCGFLNSSSFGEIFVLHWTSSVVRKEEVCSVQRKSFIEMWGQSIWTEWGERESVEKWVWPCCGYRRKGRWTCPGGRERRGAGRVGQGILVISKERTGLAVGIMRNDQLCIPETEVAVRERRLYRASYRERKMER